jgi:hypothetical protein
VVVFVGNYLQVVVSPSLLKGRDIHPAGLAATMIVGEIIF